MLLQDLGSKVNPNSKELTKRRDAFIVMLHHIQVTGYPYRYVNMILLQEVHVMQNISL